MKPVILINRLLTTPNGWSYNFQDRIEKSFSMYDGEYEIIFYPEKQEVKLGDLFRDFLPMAVDYAHLSAKDLWAYNKSCKRENRKIEKVIFLEPFQFPHMQIIMNGLNDVNWEVFMHSSLQYNEYYKFNSLYKMFYTSFPKMLCNTEYTGLSYDEPHLGFPKYHVVGGALEDFDQKNFNRADRIMWAGSRYKDEVKGYDAFIEIVEEYPKRQFEICLDRKPEHALPSNVSVYIEVDSNAFRTLTWGCKYILSTAKEETFGYSVMDAVADGAIPIVPNRSAYPELIPHRFRYLEGEDLNHYFELEAEDKELCMIVKRFFYGDFAERLLNDFS